MIQLTDNNDIINELKVLIEKGKIKLSELGAWISYNIQRININPDSSRFN